MALAFAADELAAVGAATIQVHGGIGFTWEHDAHLFYKRLLTLQQHRWWRDRPGAARAFVERVRAAAEADRFAETVVVVLEGAARSGIEEGIADGVRVLHAPRSGDDMLIAVVTDATSQVTTCVSRSCAATASRGSGGKGG